MLLIFILLLILTDLFLAYELPTHIAYVLLTLLFISAIDINFLYQVFFAVLLWFAFLVFHYTIWGKVIEKIHDRFIAPTKHVGGIESCIGKLGVINKLEGKYFICIGEELYEFENTTSREIIEGKSYRIIKTKSNKLII